MFNHCPLSQTGSPSSLRRRGIKAKYKHCFYQKANTRKKINKITIYQWKPTYFCAPASEKGQNLHQAQAVKEEPSSQRTLWLCIDQLQVDVLAEQGTRGAGQGRGWPCCHVQSLPTEAQQVCLVYQLCNRKWHQSGHPRSHELTVRLSHSWPHCRSVSPFTIPSSRKSCSVGKTGFGQKYLVFVITQRGCLVCSGN